MRARARREKGPEEVGDEEEFVRGFFLLHTHNTNARERERKI